MAEEEKHFTAERSAGGTPAANLRRMEDWSYLQLQAEWRRLFRSPPPKQMSREMLRLGIGWSLQAKQRGGHGRSERNQMARLSAILNDGGMIEPPRTVTLKTGARLVREWRGETHDVIVVEGGFQWKSKVWRSLSVIAREITGTRWSGPRFFGVFPSSNRGALNPVADENTALEAD